MPRRAKRDRPDLFGEGAIRPTGDGVALPDEVALFVQALEEEISAARKLAASNSVPLRNGRCIARSGQQFVYAFQIENELFLPADSPADLIVGGKAAVNATVVSVEGLSITLAVGEHLGHFVAEARLQTDLSQLLKRLISRLEDRASRANPLGDLLMKGGPRVGAPLEFDERQFTQKSLNAEQRSAVEQALGHNITFIQGPPGTGKSEVIGALGRQLLHRHRRALIVSHTNSAVDQALLRIVGRGVSTEELERGTVVRIGQPKDPELMKNPLLHVDHHVKKRSESLVTRRQELEHDAKVLADKVVALRRQIELVELVPEAEIALASVASDTNWLASSSSELAHTEESLARLKAKNGALITVREAARKALSLEETHSVMRRRVVQLQQERESQKAESMRAGQLLASAKSRLKASEKVEWMRVELKWLPDIQTAVRTEDECIETLELAKSTYESAAATLRTCTAQFDEVNRTSWMGRKLKGLPSPDSLKASLSKAQESERKARSNLSVAEAAAQSAAETLAKVREKQWMRVELQDVEILESARAKVEAAVRLQVQAESAANKASRSLLEAEHNFARADDVLSAFVLRYGMPPSKVLAASEQEIERVQAAEQLAKDFRKRLSETTKRVEGVLDGLEKSIRRLELVIVVQSTLADRVKVLRDAVEAVKASTLGVVVSIVKRDCDEIDSRLLKIRSEIAELDNKLKSVELTVVSEAQVVAATLTGSYLRDSLKSGGFDIVVLDEASMAPIPALWYAAGLAEKAVVVVGDPRQLPPIVVADDDTAKKVLGTDVFTGLEKWRERNAVGGRVALREQLRMHPEIASIVSELVYATEGGLRSPASLHTDPASFEAWFKPRAGFDKAVVLVSTAKLNAWVTAVNRGGRSSRLNYLSAALCVEIASQMLRVDRRPAEVGEAARVFIVSPYRPHARLVSLMLKEEALQNEVLAGTAHSFQGSEADVVILDLVNDEPHWKVGMFMPANDDQMRRMLNVAMTRARRRLVVVGDLDYIASKAKKAFVGRELLPYLRKKYRELDATNVVPHGAAAGLAARTLAAVGGVDEPGSNRLIATQEQFFALFERDLLSATSRVIIFSPFATKDRVARLEPFIRAAISSGVAVHVVTKSLPERRDAERSGYREIETQLTAWGVSVIHKGLMHEKIVLIDDRIVWTGSLNAMSFSNTREIMERRESKDLVADYWEALQIDDLLADLKDNEPICPICASVMAWREGKSGAYWQCVLEDCKFTRSVGEPAPRDGEIRCRKCNSDVEFGEWGGRWVWRCLENTRHRQPFGKAHLKLDKMRAKVPKEVRRKFE